MLDIDSLTVTYGDVTAVDDVSLSVEEGEFFTLLGPSGCGKSTILRTIAGFVSPAAGDIRVSGESILGLGPEEREVGIVFQNYALFPHMTVFENVAFGMRIRRLKDAAVRERVAEFLRLVDIEELASRKVSELSGGQQQRVGIARSLILEPRILLLDEPLSNLDAKLRLTMRNGLRRLQRRLGITTIYVTHDQDEALAMSDRIAVLDNGVVEQAGTPREIYTSPASEFVCRFVGESIELGPELIASVANGQAGELLGRGRCFLRLESVRLGADGGRSEISFPATVRDVEYGGMLARYTVETPVAPIRLVAVPQHSHAPAVGEEVLVGFNASDVMSFADE